MNQETPLEIVLESCECLERLHLLAEFMEMPDHVKLIQLALLVNSDKAEELNEEIHRILTALPVEMVGNVNPNILSSSPDQVSTTRPQNSGVGTILQDCVLRGKLDLVRDLLEFG